MKYALAKVTAVKALPGHRLAVTFADGAKGTYDCTPLLWGEMFQPLKHPKFFAQVSLDHGAPSWPNGADIDPGVIREDIEAAGVDAPRSALVFRRAVRRTAPRSDRIGG